jgi:hypothetical protein
MTTLEEVIFDEARRQLEQQATVLESLRSRAITVLGAGGVVAGLFVDHLAMRLDGFSWSALVLFLISALAAVVVVTPLTNLALSENLRSSLDWYDRYSEFPKATEVFLVSAAQNLRRDQDANRSVLRRASWCFAVESALLAIQLLFWVLGAAVG